MHFVYQMLQLLIFKIYQVETNIQYLIAHFLSSAQMNYFQCSELKRILSALGNSVFFWLEFNLEQQAKRPLLL